MYTYQNFLKLHRWLIEIRSIDKDILGAVSEHVVNLKKNIFTQNNKAIKVNSLFQIDVLPSYESSFQNKLEEHSYVERIPSCKMLRAYDFNQKRVWVSYLKDSTFPSPFLYHRFFLEPISQLLRSEEASLIHGAILSKGGEGILLIGPKGAGKSSLSTALIELGFDYYGDEHPIL
ncbi:MAG: hypothetical protein ACKOA8_01495, partial [Deltaproteobacteria bacterium]